MDKLYAEEMYGNENRTGISEETERIHGRTDDEGRFRTEAA
nr:MAG TPA_asm: hypothetical protein [Caudoviricetes sp.]